MLVLTLSETLNNLSSSLGQKFCYLFFPTLGKIKKGGQRYP